MKRNIYIFSIIFGFFVTLISINKSSASCTITGGVIDNGFLTDAGNDFSCFTAPDLYEIVAYEMYLWSIKNLPITRSMLVHLYSIIYKCRM